MKRIIISMLLIAVLFTACSSDATVGSMDPEYIDTGVDSDAWATVPAGLFPFGQENEITDVDYEYQMMVTDVTVEQYAAYLNEALASGDVNVGEFEIEAGDFNKYGCDIFYRVTNTKTDDLVVLAKTGVVFFDYSKNNKNIK